MATMIYCSGTLSVATAGGRAMSPVDVLGCSVPWTQETYTPGDLAKIQEINMYTHEIFDLLFVISLFMAFALGFHKGGQR